MTFPKRIMHNRAKCLVCGEIVESIRTHDQHTCSCGSLSVDGGKDYIRRTYREEGCFEDLTEYEDIPIITDRKPTGIQAHNGMMHVGDSVMYEDGWLCFVAKIVEVEGKFGFFFDEEFMELSDFIFFPDVEIPGLDFEILPENHNEPYGIHAPIYKK